MNSIKPTKLALYLLRALKLGLGIGKVGMPVSGIRSESDIRKFEMIFAALVPLTILIDQ